RRDARPSSCRRRCRRRRAARRSRTSASRHRGVRPGPRWERCRGGRGSWGGSVAGRPWTPGRCRTPRHGLCCPPLDSQNRRRTTMSSLPDVSALADQAEQHARAGRPELAARLYQQVLSRAPDHARALSWFAMQAYGRGDLDRALELIEQACRGQPKLALAEANRALLLQARGDLEGAVAALLAALE